MIKHVKGEINALHCRSSFKEENTPDDVFLKLYLEKQQSLSSPDVSKDKNDSTSYVQKFFLIMLRYFLLNPKLYLSPTSRYGDILKIQIIQYTITEKPDKEFHKAISPTTNICLVWISRLPL